MILLLTVNGFCFGILLIVLLQAYDDYFTVACSYTLKVIHSVYNCFIFQYSGIKLNDQVSTF